MLPVSIFCRCSRAEKDASAWSKDKLKSLLVGLKFDGEEGKTSTDIHTGWRFMWYVCAHLVCRRV